MGDEQIVQPSRARKPGVQRRVEHACRIAQQAFGMIERQCLHEVFRRQSGPAAKQKVQFIRRDTSGIRHRFDGRLRTPVLGDESDGAPHRIIVAKRGVMGAGLGQAPVVDCEVHVIIHGKVHHALRCRRVVASKPPDFRQSVIRPDYRSGRAGRQPRRPLRLWQSLPFRPVRGSSRRRRGGPSRPDKAFQCRIPRAPSGRAVPTTG